MILSSYTTSFTIRLFTIAIRGLNEYQDTCAVESITIKSLITFTRVVAHKVLTGCVLVAVIVVSIQTLIDV